LKLQRKLLVNRRKKERLEREKGKRGEKRGVREEERGREGKGEKK
jgi:hypothetical protein